MNTATSPSNFRTRRRRLQRRRRQQDLRVAGTISEPTAANVAVGKEELKDRISELADEIISDRMSELADKITSDRISVLADEIMSDRISELPEEIIHEILTRLRSRKEATKISVLSKRWTQIWQSYPVLEFEDVHEFESISRKFSGRCGIEALRMTFTKLYAIDDSPLFNGIWSLAKRFPPKEITIHVKHQPRPHFDILTFCILIRFAYLTSLGLFRGLQFCGLQVLKLRGFRFCSFLDFLEKDGNTNPFVWFGSSLKVLCLEEARFSCDLPFTKCGIRDVRILNRMIADGHMLERLTLSSIKGIRGLEIRNHPKLKFLQVEHTNVESLQIIGAPSLEILRMTDCEVSGNLRISSASNLKVLQIKSTNWSIDKLISKLPSIESILLTNPPQICEVKILNEELGELALRFSPKPGEIKGHIAVVSLYCKLNSYVNVKILKKLITNLSLFQVTLELSQETTHKIFLRSVLDKMHIPNVECLKLPSHLLASCYEQNSLGSPFQLCSPKLLYIVDDPDRKSSYKFSSLYFRIGETKNMH